MPEKQGHDHVGCSLFAGCCCWGPTVAVLHAAVSHWPTTWHVKRRFWEGQWRGGCVLLAGGILAALLRSPFGMRDLAMPQWCSSTLFTGVQFGDQRQRRHVVTQQNEYPDHDHFQRARHLTHPNARRTLPAKLPCRSRNDSTKPAASGRRGEGNARLQTRHEAGEVGSTSI